MTKWRTVEPGWVVSDLGGLVKELNRLWHFYSKDLRQYSVPYGPGFESLSQAKKYAESDGGNEE